MNRRKTVVALLLCCFAGIYRMASAPSPGSAAAGRTILFVDDHDVLYRAGTERVLTQLKRHAGNPVVKPEKPWEVQLAFTSVYRAPETGKYQMWYQEWNGDRARERTHNSVVAYAQSSDGVHKTGPGIVQV